MSRSRQAWRTRSDITIDHRSHVIELLLLRDSVSKAEMTFLSASESMKSSQECLNRTSAGETRGGDHSSGNGSGVFEDHGCSSARLLQRKRPRQVQPQPPHHLCTYGLVPKICEQLPRTYMFPFPASIDDVDGDAAMPPIFTGTILPRRAAHNPRTLVFVVFSAPHVR